MKKTRVIMGMPVTVEIVGQNSDGQLIEKTFSYFNSVDEKFSTYKENSEISKFNRGEVSESSLSPEMKDVFALAEETKKISGGYFNILTPEGLYDPSGLVKGWAIYQAAELLKKEGCKNFFIEAGGDIQAYGKNLQGGLWSVGIQSPFNQKEIVKVVQFSAKGMATSGTYVRGQHIYNPFKSGEKITDVVSLSVIGPNVYEADRFATAAFAMGLEGIDFIERLEGFEGYQIDSKGMALMTSNFKGYLK